MRAYLVTIAVSTACYSPSVPGAPVDSQPPADAPAACQQIGHDEDGDQIDDGCDPCPIHAGGDVRDDDADGLGVDCDPNPGLADSTWLFENFSSGAKLWAVTLPWAVGGDQLQVDTGDTDDVPYVVLPLAPAMLDNFDVTTTLVAQTKQGSEAHFGISILGMGGDHEVDCWLLRTSTGGYIAVEWQETRRNGQTFGYKESAFAWTDGASYQLTLKRRGTTFACNARGPGLSAETSLTSTMTPDTTGGVDLWVFQVVANFKSVFVAGPKP